MDENRPAQSEFGNRSLPNRKRSPTRKWASRKVIREDSSCAKKNRHELPGAFPDYSDAGALLGSMDWLSTYAAHAVPEWVM